MHNRGSEVVSTAALPPRPMTASPTPPPASGARPPVGVIGTEHPIRCAATIEQEGVPCKHSMRNGPHECLHPARIPKDVIGIIEHRCLCGIVWTESTNKKEE